MNCCSRKSDNDIGIGKECGGCSTDACKDKVKRAFQILAPGTLGPVIQETEEHCQEFEYHQKEKYGSSESTDYR